MLRGIKENIILENVIAKHNIALKTNPNKGRVVVGQIAGFSMALAIAKGSGEETLDTVLSIICESRWDMAKAGLSANTLHAVYYMLRLHPEHKAQVKEELISLFTPIDPDQLFAKAYAKYPNRRERERNLMYIEDIFCEKLGISRVYTGGSILATLNRAA